MRLEEQSAIIRESVPAGYADLFLAVTTLGGTTVPMILLAVLFWLSSANRRRVALAVSYAFVGVSFLIALKALIGLPRPPEEVFLVPLEADAYGFPSGHAFAAVVVYGGLAVAFDRVRDWRALLAVGTITILVSVSRVVLGVHYVGDVIAGTLLGIVFLAALTRLVGDDPQRGFAIAIGLSIPALVVTGVSTDAILGFGGAVGGWIATRWLERLPPLRSPLEGAILVGVAGGIVAAGRSVESTVESFEPALAALYAILVAVIFLAPIAVGRLPLPGSAVDDGRQST